MKKHCLRVVVIILSVFLPVAAAIAQTANISGVVSTDIPVKEGKVTVILPSDIRPGDMISGTVTADPNGSSEKQVARNKAALATYSISIAGIHFTIIPSQSQPVKFVATAGMKVIVSDKSSAEVGNFVLEMSSNSYEPAKNLYIPLFALTAAPVRIAGNFDGDFSNTKCRIDGKPMEILAESPRQTICTMPETQSGQHTITIEEKGTTTVSRISAVNLDLSAAKTNLKRGERTTISVEVSGLQGINSNASINLTNTSPSTISLVGGNTQTIPVTASQVSVNGSFTHTVDVQSIAAGTFTVNADLQLPQTGSNGTVFTENKDSLPNFKWARSSSASTPVKYKVNIIPVYPGQTTGDAIAKNGQVADGANNDIDRSQLRLDVPKSDPSPDNDNETGLVIGTDRVGNPRKQIFIGDDPIPGGGQVVQPKPNAASPKNNCDKELADLEAARNALKNAQAALKAWQAANALDIAFLKSDHMADLQRAALAAPKDKYWQQALNKANEKKEALNTQRMALVNAINAAAKDLSVKEDAYNKCVASNK